MKRTIFLFAILNNLVLFGYSQDVDTYLPMFEEGKEWICKSGRIYTNTDHMYSVYQSMTHRLVVKGDTIVDGGVCKKIVEEITYETGKEETNVYCVKEDGGIISSNDYWGRINYDFTLQKGDSINDFTVDNEYLNAGWIVSEVSDTILDDGYVRKCLYLTYFAGGAPEEVGNDVWVEGIGSLKTGLIRNYPFLRSSMSPFYELQSVSLNGEYLYNKNGIIYPFDKTHLIQNPDYSNNDNAGWEGTMPAFMYSNNAEHYQKTFNTYQDLENLPNGVYAVSLSGFYKYGFQPEFNVEEMMYAKLYAKSGKDSLNADFRSILVGARETPFGLSFERVLPNGLYIPNRMSSASVYLQDPAYRTTLFFDVEDGKARIGVKKDTLLGYDWAIWQDWSLAYYGNDADAYQVWLDTVLAEAPRFEGQTLSVGMLESYNSMLSSFTPDKASILSAIKLIAEESAKLKANTEAWQAYEKEVEYMNEVLEAPYIYRGKEYFELVKYSETVPAIIAARTLTTEEIIAETEILSYLRCVSIRYSPLLYGIVNESHVSYIDFDVEFVTDLTVNCTYTQQVDSIVGNVIYVSGQYNSSSECLPEERIEKLELNGLSEGEYILCHLITDVSSSVPDTVSDYTLYFTYSTRSFPHHQVINGTYLRPRNPLSEQDITFISDIIVNCNYEQRIDSIVENKIYVTTTYDTNRNCPIMFTLTNLPLGKLSEGDYELYHRVTDLSKLFPDATSSISFTVRDGASGIIQSEQSSCLGVVVCVNGQTIHCSSPEARILEVYTLDGMKVGESIFQNGEAVVKVDKVPATYLYVITYPDGRRTSGKVVVN